MRLRIYRTFSWEVDCRKSEICLGGKNPMKLVDKDELQFFDPFIRDWVPVELVEEEKPINPDLTHFRINVDSDCKFEITEGFKKFETWEGINNK